MRAVILLCLLEAALASETYHWSPRHVTLDPDLKAANECNMDQGSCGCCLMLQKMHSLRTYFNVTLNKLEKEYLHTEQCFNNIQASRTAFTVALHNGKSLNCYGPFPKDELVVYRHVILNLGGGFNVGTGIFTATHTGVYSIALSVYSDAGAPGIKLAACAGLQVNGRVIAGTTDKNANDQEDSGTVVVAKHLRAGDKVAVNLPSGCFLCDDNNHYNTFSAFLLYPTE